MKFDVKRDMALLICIAIPRAALAAGPQNIFIAMLTPCVFRTSLVLPNRFHPANENISLNNSLSQIKEYLHALNLCLQKYQYMVSEAVGGIRHNKAYKISLSPV